MSQLTKSQQEFLLKHQLPLGLTFDARGLPVSRVADLMRLQGKIVAFNTTQCFSKLHESLRDRNGHCLQCDTARVAFAKRSIAFEYIYIAGTLKGKLLKVGLSKRKSERKESLNKSKYGGFSDWEILYSAQCLNTGKVEAYLQTALKRYKIYKKYNHDNHIQTADELFQCGYNRARQTIYYIQEEYEVELLIQYENKGILHKYNFPNLLSGEHIG